MEQIRSWKSASRNGDVEFDRWMHLAERESVQTAARLH